MKQKKMNRKIIGICGRSCSGKTTIAKKIIEFYGEANCVHIKADRFFVKETEHRYREKPIWETPDVIRFDLLINTLEELKKGKKSYIPSKGWTEKCDMLVENRPIIIVEGFLLFTRKDIVDLVKVV